MKKLLSICLVMLLLLACVPMQAFCEGDSPTFAAGSAAALPGETVQIPILIENNPGVMGVHIVVSFDTNVLTLEGDEYASLFSDGVYTPGGTYATSTFGLLWGDYQINHTDSGTFATLTFRINEDAPAGVTAIAVSYVANSTFDVNMDNVAFETRNGSVTVLPTETGGWYFSEGTELCTLIGENDVNYIVGMDWLYPAVSDYIETTGGWTFDVTLNSAFMESTGAEVLIKNENGEVVETYFTTLYGDITSDGIFNGADITELLHGIGYGPDWSQIFFMDENPYALAADMDHNGTLDGNDVTVMMHMQGYTITYNQAWNEYGDLLWLDANGNECY